MKCMHDWGWSVIDGSLRICCKQEGCEYFGIENSINLISFREIYFKIGRENFREKMLEIIMDMPNPYPNDIFVSDNTKDGQFGKFGFKVVENIRKDLIARIGEE